MINAKLRLYGFLLSMGRINPQDIPESYRIVAPSNEVK